MNSKIISGSFWLSFGSIFSRVLGIVYLIPWLAMLGSPNHQTTAQAIFNSAYTPYALFISLGTAGFPSAIARRVAYYNGQGKPNSAKRVTQTGFVIMLLSGIICGILLYAFAPLLASSSPVKSTSDATLAIRALVPAIVILPSMSALRGWFQGNGDLKPYGLSQLWEQLVRVIVILAGTYFIIEVLHKNYIQAVYISVAAAFFGAVFSYGYLLVRLIRHHRGEPAAPDLAEDTSVSQLSKTLLMISYESIPFVIVGSGITLCQLVDQLFFKQILIGSLHMSAGYTQYLYTIFSANPNKITTVVISLAMAVSESSLPLISGKLSSVKTSYKSIEKLITDNLKLLLVTLLPMVIMISALSYPIYGIFFNFDKLGAHYLVYNVVQSFVLGLGIDVLTLMQALRMSKLATVTLLVGLGIKLILQWPLVFTLQGLGAILATTIAFCVVILMGLHHIRRYYRIHLRELWAIVRLNLIFAVMLVVVTLLLNHVLTAVVSKMLALLLAGVLGLIYVAVYVVLTNATGVAEKAFGQRIGLNMLHR